MAQPTRIIIGTETNQYLAQQVLRYSIESQAKKPVEITCMQQDETLRVGGTNFGFVRFFVPQACGYKGRAIYQDADQLVFTDINELVDQLDDQHDIALVNKPEGFFNGKVPGQHNQTSVMVLNCENLKEWQPETMFKHVVGNREELKDGQIHYRDFMTVKWMDQSRIQPIDPSWNHFNVIKDDTKLVHFSHVRSQPWRTPTHELTDLWADWLKRAMKAGYVRRRDVVGAVMKKHIHRHFLRYAL